MLQYVHTNILQKTVKKLFEFYKKILHCKGIGETKNLQGVWLDKLTELTNTHIVGEHVCLSGYEEDYPTLQFFSL